MALTLEEALTELGILKGKVGPLEAEVTTLRGHKERLETDLAKVKGERKTAQERVAELEPKVPADGAVVLSTADAARWSAYQSLGKVDEVKASLERVSTLEAEKNQADREATIRTAGYDPKKLGRLIGDAPLKTEGEGDDLKVTLTVGDKDVALSEWAETEGIGDLLNVARLTGTDARPAAMAQAGIRRQGGPRLSTPEEIAESQRGDPKYSI